MNDQMNQLIREQEKINKFTHTQLNFKCESMLKHFGSSIEFGHHIDTSHETWHEEYHMVQELAIIKVKNKKEAMEICDIIKYTWDLEVYYMKPYKQVEITLYKYLS